MPNLKEEFRIWMLNREKKVKNGSTYGEKSVKNCINFLGSALSKLDIIAFQGTDNTIFCCNTYSEFLEIDESIRNHPNFYLEDGDGKAQRWISRGLMLYGYFLLEREGKSEEERDDNLTSITFGSKRDGKKLLYYTVKYERRAENRNAAILYHGSKCFCCGFDFEETYGELGKGYIEVHHIVPLHSLDEEIDINPNEDLVCVCSNCHKMIHRKRDAVVDVEQLRQQVLEQKNSFCRL